MAIAFGFGFGFAVHRGWEHFSPVKLSMADRRELESLIWRAH